MPNETQQKVDILLVVPLAPHGQGRPRTGVIAGHARVFKDAESRKWETMLAQMAVTAFPSTVLEGALRLDVANIVARPKYLLQRFAKPRPDGFGPDKTWKYPVGLLWRPHKPDASNCLKSVEDALNEVLWRDDAQVVSPAPLNFFAEVDGTARTVIRIRHEDRDPEAVALATFGPAALSGEIARR